MIKRALSYSGLLASLLLCSSMLYPIVKSTTLPPRKTQVQKAKPTVAPQPPQKPVPGKPAPAKPKAPTVGAQAAQWWTNFLANKSMSWKCAALKLAAIIKQDKQKTLQELATSLEKLSNAQDLFQVLEGLKKYQAALPAELKAKLKPYESSDAKGYELIQIFQARIAIKQAKC